MVMSCQKESEKCHSRWTLVIHAKPRDNTKGQSYRIVLRHIKSYSLKEKFCQRIKQNHLLTFGSFGSLEKERREGEKRLRGT